MKLTHHYLDAANLQFHYVQAGTGIPVVLLSGFPQTWYSWKKLIPLLSDRYSVYAIDLPGLGDSGKPSNGYDVQAVAQRIHELVRALKLDYYHLVGHDVGAWIGYFYGATYPTELKKLTLIDAGIPGISLPETVPTAKDVMLRWHFLFQQLPDLPELLVQGREKDYIRWFFNHRGGSTNWFNESDLDEYVRAYSAPDALRASFAYYRAIALSAEQNKNLPKIPVPVLSVSGEKGAGPNMGAALRKYIDNLEELVIPNCGHYVPEEQPKVLAERLLKFFENNES
jgi:pimeloyl-ACP methyl ester carboxylesterase